MHVTKTLSFFSENETWPEKEEQSEMKKCKTLRGKRLYNRFPLALSLLKNVPIAALPP